MPPSYVKPYVKRQKNDAADAEAICEAVTRPTMRFVEVKTREQQSTLVLHRTLVQLMAHRTTKVAAVALANKTARMVWAIMTSGESYREPVPRTA